MYEHEGIVTRFSTIVSDGFTYHYMLLAGKDHNIFTASSSISDELPLTKEGDIVKVSYIDDKNGTIDITKFNNLSISTPTSDNQIVNTQINTENLVLDSDVNNIIEVNPNATNDAWNNMSNEERARMLQNYEESNSSVD